MKKHLALFAAFFAVVLMASTAIAQDTTPTPATPAAATATKAKKGKGGGGGGASAKADSDLANLTKTLTLTDDQQAKIKPILADESAKIRASKKANASATPEYSKAKSKVIRDDANQQIRALLTPDQQKTFDSTSKKEGGKKAAAAPAA